MMLQIPASLFSNVAARTAASAGGGGGSSVFDGATTNSNQSETTIDLPSSISAGDLLIIVSHVMWTVSSAPADFTEVLVSTDGSGGTGVLYIWAKIATGSEGASIGFTTAASDACHCTYRIPSANHDVSAGIAAGLEGTETDEGPTLSSTPDPPSIAPSWGTGRLTGFIAAAGIRRGARAVPTLPSGYGDELHESYPTDNRALPTLTTCHREATTASEDPGVFDYSADGNDENWKAATLAIRGAA